MIALMDSLNKNHEKTYTLKFLFQFKKFHEEVLFKV